MTPTDALNQDLSFSETLKYYSRKTHDSVDNLVMSMQPFADLDNYAKFLQAQYEFHRTLKSAYQDDSLNEQIPNLATLSRLDKVVADMKDLSVEPSDIALKQPNIEVEQAVGWLYCAEGSNVGAAILYKEAGKIKLSDEYGASHLAAHPDGRMPHWRAFKTTLDNLALTDGQKAQALLGADEAFAYFKHLIREIYTPIAVV